MSWRQLGSLLAFCLLAAAANAAETPKKILRIAALQAENSFDPAAESEESSLQYCQNMFDAMLTYDLLARPVKLVPNTLVDMPEASGDGTTFTFHLQPGIYFASDPAFKGKPRELVASDYVYSLKRLLDPVLHSPWKFLLDGKLAGAERVEETANRTGHLDYAAAIDGLRALDRYTLRIRLKAPDFNLLYILAMPAASALAQEVVEYYGRDVGAHPVGTGPYVLKEWRRSSRVVLERNPGYREEFFHAEPEATEWDAEIMHALDGKRIPVNDRIEVNIIEAEQPRWLAFLNNELDLIEILPEEYGNVAVPNGKVAPNIAKQGVRLQREAKPDVSYIYFNMQDPVVGGYTPDKVALRRAISLAVDKHADISIVRNNQALPADTIVPPGIPGYDADFRDPWGEADVAEAKALLDLFGYVDRDGDGYRELPDGKPLSIEYASPVNALNRRMDQLIQKSLQAIGIRITFRKSPQQELRKLAKLGQTQMRTDNWQADYPDAGNFFQLLYGPNTGQLNYARFQLPEFDRLYEKTAAMPNSPERFAIFRKMTELVLAYAPWHLTIHRIQNHLIRPWVSGYKRHPYISMYWRYIDIDVARQQAGK
jgi:oligopeptide transport system substrate-binding protein